MTNSSPGTPFYAHVGDAGRLISFRFLKSNRKEVRNLTGYAARVFFTYLDGTPLVRAATVDGVNGKVTYRLRGDEFSVKGICEVQPFIMPPDWYGNLTAIGQAYEETAGEIVKFTVLARPT